MFTVAQAASCSASRARLCVTYGAHTPRTPRNPHKPQAATQAAQAAAQAARFVCLLFVCRFLFVFVVLNFFTTDARLQALWPAVPTGKPMADFLEANNHLTLNRCRHPRHATECAKNTANSQSWCWAEMCTQHPSAFLLTRKRRCVARSASAAVLRRYSPRMIQFRDDCHADWPRTLRYACAHARCVHARCAHATQRYARRTLRRPFSTQRACTLRYACARYATHAHAARTCARAG